jgi:hypothetical protein
MISIPRKTSDSIDITIEKIDDTFAVGEYTLYFTVRNVIPPTSLNNDDDANTIFKITQTITLLEATDTLSTILTLDTDDTNIAPRTYLYDIKLTYPDDTTKQITIDEFVITPDITRRNNTI